jgi:hypothetical protein
LTGYALFQNYRDVKVRLSFAATKREKVRLNFAATKREKVRLNFAATKREIAVGFAHRLFEYGLAPGIVYRHESVDQGTKNALR